MFFVPTYFYALSLVSKMPETSAAVAAAAAPIPRTGGGGDSDGAYPVDTSGSGSGRPRPPAMAVATGNLDTSRGARWVFGRPALPDVVL